MPKRGYVKNLWERARDWESTKRWRERNPERYQTAFRKGLRKWEENNRDKRRSYSSIWRSKNKEKVREQCRKRRLRKKGVECSLTLQEWQAILQDYEWSCAYCGSTDAPCQDHVIPLSLGGPHTKENVVPACRSCNSKKGTKLWTPKKPTKIS